MLKLADAINLWILLRVSDGLKDHGQLRCRLRPRNSSGLEGSGCGVLKPHVVKKLYHTISQSRSYIIEIANRLSLISNTQQIICKNQTNKNHASLRSIEQQIKLFSWLVSHSLNYLPVVCAICLHHTLSHSIIV